MTTLKRPQLWLGILIGFASVSLFTMTAAYCMHAAGASSGSGSTQVTVPTNRGPATLAVTSHTYSFGLWRLFTVHSAAVLRAPWHTYNAGTRLESFTLADRDLILPPTPPSLDDFIGQHNHNTLSSALHPTVEIDAQILKAATTPGGLLYLLACALFMAFFCIRSTLFAKSVIAATRRRLHACGHCGYTLKERTACPECGSSYNATTHTLSKQEISYVNIWILHCPPALRARLLGLSRHQN